MPASRHQHRRLREHSGLRTATRASPSCTSSPGTTRRADLALRTRLAGTGLGSGPPMQANLGARVPCVPERQGRRRPTLVSWARHASTSQTAKTPTCPSHDRWHLRCRLETRFTLAGAGGTLGRGRFSSTRARREPRTASRRRNKSHTQHHRLTVSLLPPAWPL